MLRPMWRTVLVLFYINHCSINPAKQQCDSYHLDVNSNHKKKDLKWAQVGIRLLN